MESYQKKILGFYKDRKRMPTYTEIMKLVGFKSKNAVYKLVGKLVEAGIIGQDSTGHLVPNKLFGEVPRLGLVEAGFPTVADEVSDTLSLDEYLIQDKESTYILEVKGDSMIDAGIQEGDLVIAQRKGEPRDGDIVIAEVDGGWTIKYFRKQGSRVFFEPANAMFKTIIPKYDYHVAAIVKGIVRKY